MVEAPFLVSAPGKTIIFGEHAAVYGKPAIAAALSLRSYLLVSAHSPAKAGQISLEFPDIKLQYSWDIASLPWDHAPSKATTPDSLCPPSELHEPLVEALETPLANIYSSFQRVAAHTFLYLYCSILSPSQTGVTFSIRSALPIGSGLGSSASVSVCLATALLLLAGDISQPVHTAEVDHGKTLDLVEAWSFLGERCMHGNPSGIDNAVSAHGGAILFQRMGKGVPNRQESMTSFPPLKLLLTDSKQPRRTAVLVGNVGTLLHSFPKIAEPIMDSIEELTNEAFELFQKPVEKCDAQWAGKLREMIRINHGLLVALGVSHPKLELIRAICDENEVGETKLTGAGGGGCAITLVNEGITEDKIEILRKQLEEHGFELFETSLGGKGVGCLFPSQATASRWEDWEERVFSLHHLLALETRDHIEETIGVGAAKGWDFW
ncbi:ribosomal protein S5 domain 2-type protein [Lipomyces oligophaga]|uniref:ribosomal protein S5 domain 2-type protein n=1 Tax=Lipomyces oligophaga TaxID=45792 RepID=UPI0034CE7599